MEKSVAMGEPGHRHPPQGKEQMEEEDGRCHSSGFPRETESVGYVFINRERSILRKWLLWRLESPKSVQLESSLETQEGARITVQVQSVSAMVAEFSLI